MTADVLEVALEFGRELCAKNETTKAKVVSALVAEVKEHRAKAEAPVDLEPLKVAIDAAKDSAVTPNDGGPITAADLFYHSCADTVVHQVVLTRDNGKPGTGWESGAIAARKWGVTGIVVDYTNSHGTGFKVRHDDGSEAWYEPDHLVMRARKRPLQCALAFIEANGAVALLRKRVAVRYSVGSRYGVVHKVIRHHETGEKTFDRYRCEVTLDRGVETVDANVLFLLDVPS